MFPEFQKLVDSYFGCLTLTIFYINSVMTVQTACTAMFILPLTSSKEIMC